MIIHYPVIHEAEEFHGFRTVHFYELECAKAGQKTERIPCFAADGAAAFALLTRCPDPCSASAFDGLDIISADEAHCLFSGAIRHDGSDLESVLYAAGFVISSSASIHEAEWKKIEEDLVQLSLFG